MNRSYQEQLDEGINAIELFRHLAPIQAAKVRFYGKS